MASQNGTAIAPYLLSAVTFHSAGTTPVKSTAAYKRTRQKVHRAIEKLASFSGEAQATAALPGFPEWHRNIPYIYVQRRGESYPAQE